MTKQELRQTYLQRRKRLSVCEHQELSERINIKLMDWFTKEKPKKIHTFLPIGKEPDIWPFIKQILDYQIELFIPVVVGKGILRHARYSGNLITGKFGTQEPAEPVWYEGDWDWVLVPLLCFDKKGYRVGYGGGYYDRILATSQAKKIGVSLFEAVELIQDVEPYDVRLDVCVSPENVYKFI